MVLSCEIITRKEFLLESGFHPEDSLLIVLEGSFVCETHNREYTVCKNEIFFFKGNDAFRRKILSPLKAVYIIFNELPLDANRKLIPLYDTRAAESIQFLVDAIAGDNTRLVEHFVNDIFYCCMHGAKKADKTISEVIDFIKENYDKNITLDLLATTFNLSKQWLILRFKKETNTTPMMYLNGFRMKMAKEFLLQQKMTVGEVAFACGFETPYYFSNAFKKTFGVSPTVWRKNMIL